jgi:hypothetical protein
VSADVFYQQQVMHALLYCTVPEERGDETAFAGTRAAHYAQLGLARDRERHIPIDTTPATRIKSDSSILNTFFFALLSA